MSQMLEKCCKQAIFLWVVKMVVLNIIQEN